MLKDRARRERSEEKRAKVRYRKIKVDERLWVWDKETEETES